MSAVTSRSNFLIDGSFWISYTTSTWDDVQDKGLRQPHVFSVEDISYSNQYCSFNGIPWTFMLFLRSVLPLTPPLHCHCYCTTHPAQQHSAGEWNLEWLLGTFSGGFQLQNSVLYWLLTHGFLQVFTGYSPVVTVHIPFNFDVDSILHSHSNLLQVCLRV